MVTTQSNVHSFYAPDSDVLYKVFVFGVTERWNREKNNLSIKQAQRVLMGGGYYGKYFRSSFLIFYFFYQNNTQK